MMMWLGAALFLIFAVAQTSASSTAKGYDQTITLFSPDGRLFQVEYAQKSALRWGSPCIAVQGRDCVVCAAYKNIPDDLADAAGITNTHRISEKVIYVGSGLGGDVLYQVRRARSQALEYKHTFGYPIPGFLLANKLADLAQLYTQRAEVRPLGCTCLLLSVEDGGAEGPQPQLHRVDPTGQSFKMWATAIGAGADDVVPWLEKRLGLSGAGQDHGQQGKGQGKDADGEGGVKKEGKALLPRLPATDSEGVRLALQGLRKANPEKHALSADAAEVVVVKKGSIRMLSTQQIKEVLDSFGDDDGDGGDDVGAGGAPRVDSGDQKG